MDPISATTGLSTGTAALGALGGSIVSGLFGQSSASKSLKFQREAAQNAHQWEVQDLIKAGLNPILSAGGSGARPGGGAQATMPDLGQAVSSALAAAKQKQEIENMKAQKGLIQTQTANIAQNMQIADPAASVAADAGKLYRAGKDVIERETDAAKQAVQNTFSSAKQGVSKRIQKLQQKLEALKADRRRQIGNKNFIPIYKSEKGRKYLERQ